MCQLQGSNRPWIRVSQVLIQQCCACTSRPSIVVKTDAPRPSRHAMKTERQTREAPPVSRTTTGLGKVPASLLRVGLARCEGSRARVTAAFADSGRRECRTLFPLTLWCPPYGNRAVSLATVLWGARPCRGPRLWTPLASPPRGQLMLSLTGQNAECDEKRRCSDTCFGPILTCCWP